MIISVTKEELITLAIKQVDNLFLCDKETEVKAIAKDIPEAIERIEHCFSFSKCKYYQKNNDIFFNPFHSGQYAIFLYFLSRILSRENNSLADKVYYLNKALNSVDLYYEVEMPRIFDLDHPLGSVIGRAKFSDFFFFTQNCTVGNNNDIYPRFGENVTMLSGATVIGNCKIGSNCIISANTYIKDQDVPDNSIVFGSSPNLIIKQKEEAYFWENGMFNSTGIS